MSDWLERDKSNGYLIGPSGAHYPNEHQAAYYDLLGQCGCGIPEQNFNFCREALSVFDRRGDKGTIENWVDSESELVGLILMHTKDVANVLAHLFDHLGLLEHGSSVRGSWLTKDGARIVDMLPATRELMDQEY